MTWITKIFSTTKAYLYSAIGLIFAGLIVAVKFLAFRNRALKTENKQAKAKIKRTKKLLKDDMDITEQADDHLIEIIKEIDDEGSTDSLSTPNTW
jgi:predicted glycosyl hydrolase (DUF1957 family)